jgi:hypothetical protein
MRYLDSRYKDGWTYVSIALGFFTGDANGRRPAVPGTLLDQLRPNPCLPANLIHNFAVITAR